MTKCKLSPAALGLAFGTFWGLTVFIVGLIVYAFHFGIPFVTAMGTVYVGYETSVLGAFFGGVFGFVHGLIVGVILGWFYNGFLHCVCCSASAHMEDGCCAPHPTTTKKKK